MRIMTLEERAYVAGIVDGEVWLEYRRKKMRRNTRPGKPVHNVLVIRMEVPQVDGRLIDYLMATTGEGNRDLKKFPNHPTFKTQHRWRLCHHAVYRVLNQIYPYLIVKQEKAKLIIDHYDEKFRKRRQSLS